MLLGGQHLFVFAAVEWGGSANSRDDNKCSSQISMQVLKGSYTLKTYPAFRVTDRSGYEPPTLFHMKQKQNEGELLDIWLTNEFDFTFTVNSVIRPHEVEGLLKILNFSGPVTLTPGCWKVFSLQFTARNAPVNVMTSVVLVTSAGFSLEIPLQIRSTMSKPYFSGTRSLSPMSSLFGSIWTPKSDPYQSQFQHDRSLSHSPQSSVSKEQAVICRQKQFSSFDPFRCHMNLDIWNSSSSRSTNSQLSNDSGYCGDV
ncbi:UNVERIFIED_CONTAM: hypothetical protein FKN15_036828 [Acipenser sinensis]